MRISLISAALAASVAFTPASAVTLIEFRDISGEWFNAVSQSGSSNVVTTQFGNGDARARWGAGGNRSGYDFTASVSPTLEVDLGNPSDTTIIGGFSHENRVINANTSITSISLKFNTNVFVDNNFLKNVTFIYDFDHWETPNDPGGLCANGGANNTGVNSNGCADRVKVNFNSQSDTFTIGNYDYALDIVGFLVGTDPVTEFWTKEKDSNAAQIRGRVALYSELVPGVPEPATWAMMIAGFGLVGVAARRRRDVARTAA